MTIKLSENSLKVLQLMSDGQPRDHAEICSKTGIDGVSCTGSISILRRREALEQAPNFGWNNRKYQVTNIGIAMLKQESSRPVVEQRP